MCMTDFFFFFFSKIGTQSNTYPTPKMKKQLSLTDTSSRMKPQELALAHLAAVAHQVQESLYPRVSKH